MANQSIVFWQGDSTQNLDFKQQDFIPATILLNQELTWLFSFHQFIAVHTFLKTFVWLMNTWFGL